MKELLQRRYRRESDGATSSSLRALAGEAPALDPTGLRAALGELEGDTSSCLRGIAAVPPPAWPELPPAGSLALALRRACEELPAGPLPLALSGGLDSAVLLAVLRDRAIPYTLATGLPGYDESPRAGAVADALGVELRLVHVGPADLVDALPAAVRAAEAPLWNLHPVSRLLLARRIAAEGFRQLVAGDGADELFRGTSGQDHLPIAAALTGAAGLALHAPYLSAALHPFAGSDPLKRELRALGRALGLPALVTDGPKQPMLAPPLDLTSLWDDPWIERLGRTLGRRP